MHYEIRKSRQTIYIGKVFSIHRDEVELENGVVADRELVEHHGGVAVLAIDSEGRIPMVRQFRYGVGKELLELPAGKTNEGEDPRECGLRELIEETGYAAGTCELITRICPTPAYDSEMISIYLATDLIWQGQCLDSDEFLSVEWMPFEEALSLCFDGTIIDAKTLAGILLYAGRR